jgi:hypothetical protein
LPPEALWYYDPLEWIKILVPPFAAFGLGMWASRLHKRWEINYLRPVIEIQDDVVVVRTDLNDENGNAVHFLANRIRVINTGRTGAEDCKVYVEFAEDDIERTGWILPDDNTALSLTLNVNIPEYVDLCAISEDGQTRVATNEHGYRLGTVESCRILGAGNYRATIRVASSKHNLRQEP